MILNSKTSPLSDFIGKYARLPIKERLQTLRSSGHIPGGQEQKEEYYRDGNIKIYHTLYNDILKNPIIIRKEKRKLEKELESSLAGEDDPSLAYKIQLLHDLAYSSKDKTLDENGDLCYRDSTNKPDFFDDPVKLPKNLHLRR